MRDRFKMIIALIMFLSTAWVSQINADNWPNCHDLFLQKCKNGYNDPEETEEGGKRMPSHQISCKISFGDGVVIQGIKYNITTYEIWDCEGEVCLASYSDESDFIDTLFSMSGEFQVRFITDEYMFVGNIYGMIFSFADIYLVKICNRSIIIDCS